jgi:tRNA pseudouridine55 synthase
MDGIVLVDKPKGSNSSQIVSKIKRLLNGAKVGHGGTLDPLATGVLVILIGMATKKSNSSLNADKEYIARIRLGITTDTLDAEGVVQRKEAVQKFPAERIEEVLQSFVGETRQTPPIYSALRFRGRRLYELARKGIHVEPEPRLVRIHRLALLDYAHPWLTIEVECSKGTYIRALARDIGQKLGCGAHVADLTRTRVGEFLLKDCIAVDELTSARLKERLIEV